MSSDFRTVVKIVEKLWECETMQAVFDTTDAFGKTLGFEVTAIAACGKMLISPGKMPPIYTNASPVWMKYYSNNDLYSRDPVVQMATRSHAPFTFESAYAEGTPEIVSFRRESTKHGLEFGWAIPIHISGMPPGVVSLVGSKEIELSGEEQLHLSIIGLTAYKKASEYFSQMIPQIGMTLTDRERAVLTLVARGKTNWEVGAVLSISEYSVRDYLKTLSVKLETSNRTHTVARAMQLGLIVP